MKGGRDGKRERDKDRQRDKSLKPGKWAVARGEVTGQSHFKEICI